jgi:hypothetical protein
LAAAGEGVVFSLLELAPDEKEESQADDRE